MREEAAPAEITSRIGVFPFHNYNDCLHNIMLTKCIR